MKRILLVDDDPRSLAALQTMLQSEATNWEVRIASGGEAAVEELERTTFDAVVCDMAMPGMDGTTLLESARRLRPGAIRMILSEPSGVAASARAMHVAHQFLPKPCTQAVLIDSLRRAFRVQDELGNSDLREIVCGITALPSPPRVFQVLTAAMANPGIDMDVVVQTVRAEASLTVKVLQLANSSCFGLGRQLADLRQAVTYLGLRTLKQVVLGCEVFGGVETRRLGAECDLEAEQRDAVTIARIAAEIVAPEPQLADAAFTAALLRDIGELVLAGHMPETFRRSQAAVRAQRCGTPPADDDAELLELHARVGGYLAGVWGLPDRVVQAVRHHHRPSRLPDQELHLAGIVHVADCLHHYLRTGGEEERARVLDRMLDHEWLEASGCGDRLEQWCQRALALGHELVETADVA